jgi:TRIAD3 protein (E3 ubiquitin-protein ligase RNF216)
VRQVENLFPEVETNYLRDLISGLIQQGVKDLIGVVCDQLSDDNYPKKKLAKDDEVHVVGVGRNAERKLDEDTLDLTSNNGVKKALVKVSKHSIIQTISEAFPDADEDYLGECFERVKASSVDPVEAISNMLLEDNKYPKKKKEAKSPEKAAFIDIEASDLAAEADVNYFDLKTEPNDEYKIQCKILLENAFPLLTVKQIEKPWHENHYRYAPTWKFLKSHLTKDEAGQVTSTTMKLLKKARKSKWQPALVPELQREKQFVQRSEHKEMEEKDRKLAEELNEKEYEETGQGIECGCCCCEYPFDEMVQCLEGHLFCKNCLKKYVEESVFGQGQIDVHCMDGSGCKSTFPMSQLRRCLPEQMLNKIMNRMQELEIMKAGIENIYQCPFCDYKAEVTNPDDKVFKCAKCEKESCRLCKEISHIPLRCEEVEKKNETDFRKTVEERMSEALIRTCPKCKQKFYKTEGCNKMTCQCGAYVCYVCRDMITHKVGYEHFCKCNRNPMPMGKCGKCQMCYLFLKNTEEEDQKLVEEMKRKVEEDYKREHPELAEKEIQIGPKEEKKKKGGKKAAKNAMPFPMPAFPMPAFPNLAAINPFAGMQPMAHVQRMLGVGVPVNRRRPWHAAAQGEVDEEEEQHLRRSKRRRNY